MLVEVKDRTVRFKCRVSHKGAGICTVAMIVQKERTKCCLGEAPDIAIISGALVLRHQATTSKRNADNCRLALA